MTTTPTHQDIIDAYRSRISQGKRVKLSKTDRASLVEWFIIDLKSCETEADCQKRCQQEIALLEEGYPVTSVAAQYLPQWRKAIEQAVADGNLPKQVLPPSEQAIALL